MLGLHIPSPASRRSRAALLFGVAALASLAAAAPVQAFDWTSHRTLNIAHQGGENEAPAATMYALERSMRIGVDMLEVDIHATLDGQLAVIHDATVDRTTDGTGRIYDMTMDEIRRLDAAYWFVPGADTVRGRDRSEYVYRGVATGDRPPPPGFRPRDFRIPTLGEVIRAYPDVPINIEIKGAADGDFASFNRNAEVLADFLNRLGRTEGIMVASFNDLALQHFHERAPQIDLAPAIVGVAAFKVGNLPLTPNLAAFQVPVSFEGIPVTDADFVRRAHAQGYAVHVWTINDEPTFRQLIEWNVDGIMTAEPARLEEFLCRNDVARPHRPAHWSGRQCNFRRASIACDVRPAGGLRLDARGRPALRLRRHDDFRGRCAGTVAARIGSRAELRRAGVRPAQARARGRFGFTINRPSDGGPRSVVVRLGGASAARRLARSGASRAAIATRPFHAHERRTAVRFR